MSTPFESKDGLTWADQWDYNNASSGSADVSAHSQQQVAQKQKMGVKIKSAASTGMDKAKVAASAGAKKVKSGTNSGIQWIKAQYHKKTNK